MLGTASPVDRSDALSALLPLTNHHSAAFGSGGVMACFCSTASEWTTDGHRPYPPRSLATLAPPCNRREFQMGHVPWMKFAPLEADRLPDQDHRLLGVGRRPSVDDKCHRRMSQHPLAFRSTAPVCRKRDREFASPQQRKSSGSLALRCRQSTSMLRVPWPGTSPSAASGGQSGSAYPSRL